MYFQHTNWLDVRKLVHPMETILENNSRVINEADKEKVRERFRRVGKLRVSDKIAAFLMSVVPALSMGAMIAFVLSLKLSRMAPIKN